MQHSRAVAGGLVVALGLVAAVPVLAQPPGSVSYEFIPIDYPGAVGTAPLGINARNEIVGVWISEEGGEFHGFTFVRGHYQTVDVSPDFANTFAQGINAPRTVVGYVSQDPEDPDAGAHGFVLRGGAFEIVDFPGALATWPSGVNERGEVVGEYYDASHDCGPGFLLSDGLFTSILPPWADCAVAHDITNNGRIVGYSWGGFAAVTGFLMDKQGFHPIWYPGAYETRLTGINARGDIVGSYAVDWHGRLHGFVLRDGVFTAVDHPDAVGDCHIRGVSDAGVIVGIYVDADGAIHGFMGTPR